MKSNVLLDAFIQLFGEEGEKKKKAALKSVLKRMKHRERELKKKLAGAKSAKMKKSVEREIEATHAQRTKGIKILRRL